MRRTALIAIVLAAVGSGAFAFAALGGSTGRPLDVTKTAHASSVHFSIAVRLVKRQQPFALHISGASSRYRAAVRLQLGAVTLKDGTQLPGTTGMLVLNRPFLYERAPDGIAVDGTIRWLRVQTAHLKPNSQAMSTLRALTPSPLLRVIFESHLRPTGEPGTYAGTAAYDDPIVETALDKLGGGLQYRDLHVVVVAGRSGLIRHVTISGRTADAQTTFVLRARLYGYGVPVKVVPPKPGTFMDQQLSQLQT